MRGKWETGYYFSVAESHRHSNSLRTKNSGTGYDFSIGQNDSFRRPSRHQPRRVPGVRGGRRFHRTAAGIDPRLIYASRKTGLLVTEENLDKLPAEALEEWNAALDEYDELVEGEPS